MFKREKEYNLYIQTSPVWKAKRQARLVLDGYECKKCGSRDRLHVHHRTYIRFGGDELITDLVTLCEACHTAVHKLATHSRASLDRVTATFLNESSPRPVTGIKKLPEPYARAQRIASKHGYLMRRITRPNEQPARYRLVGRKSRFTHPASKKGLTVEQVVKLLEGK